MKIKYFLREYIKKLPYIVILTLICIFSTYVFHGYFLIREIVVNTLAMNVLVMYWSKWFPAHGEFCLRKSLLRPEFFMIILVLPITLYVSTRYVPACGEFIEMNAIKCMLATVLAVISLASLDRSRYTDNL